MNKKIVIITGASSGIGAALCRKYAEEGYQVVMAARNLEKLQETAASIPHMADQLLAVQTDVSREADCKNLIEKTIKTYGKIDILINNAGISMRAMFKDLDLDVIRQLMDVNFWGTVYCTKYALPYLLKQKGSVVGVISIAGHVGLPARTGYSSSKFAIRGFLDTLRIEHLKDDLHVLVAAPGFTSSNIRNTALKADGSRQGKTPRNEGKMMSAEKVAEKIFKAVRKRRSSLILTFVEGKLTVFLGKCCPRLLDKLIYKEMAKEPDSPLKQKPL